MWVDKYRPKTIYDVALEDDIKTKLINQLNNKSINHSIFVGKPGTGKTSLALVIRDTLIKDDSDVLFMNASGDRGIDTIRDVVIDFIKTPPFKSNIKLVIMDEADNLTSDAWKTLRNPIENPEINVNLSSRFIFTANYEQGIPDFIKSRCDLYKFYGMPKEKAYDKAFSILQNEMVEYEEKDVYSLVNDKYPDLRAIINSLESNTIDNKFSYNYTESVESIVKSLFNQFIDAIIHDKDYDKASTIIYQIRNSIGSNVVNYIELTRYFMDNVDLPIAMIPIMNHYFNQFNMVIDPRLHFIAMLGDMMLVYKRIGG
jgi:DNA polymerase III delta prime subunit